MKHQVLTENITALLALKSLDATHNAAIDTARTARENMGRYWPYTRGRIYFKKGTSSDLIWQVRNVFEHEYQQGNTKLTENVAFHLESAPWKTPHVRQVGKFQSHFAYAKKTTGTACKGEPGPPKTYIWYMKEPITDPDTRVLIAEWGVQSKWELHGNNLTSVEPELDQAALFAKLNAPDEF